MSINLDGYTDAVALIAAGWTLRPARMMFGNANTNGPKRTVKLQRTMYANPDQRVRHYVVPHEIGHALTWEHAQAWESRDLAHMTRALGVPVNLKSALELVADAYALWRTPGSQELAWVLASIRWHNEHGYRYPAGLLQHPAVLDFLTIITTPKDPTP